MDFKIMELIIKWFYAPISIIRIIRNKILPQSPIDSYTLRIVNYFNKKNICFVKFQIINTRATFDVEISSLVTSKYLLTKISPFYLFELGFNYKDNYNFLLDGKENKKIIFQKMYNSIFKIKPKEYPMRIENFQLIKNEIIAFLRIISTSICFEIPLNELTKDFTLLSNVEPSDLIAIGYSIREIEVEKNIKINIRVY